MKGVRKFSRKASTRATSRKPLAKRASQLRSVIRKEIAKTEELKYKDVPYTATGVDYSGSIIALSDIAQGDTDSTRDGDKLTPVGIYLKANIITGDATNMVRVLLIRWLPNTAISSAPTVGEVMQATAQPYAPEMGTVWDYRNQINILFDRLVSVDTYNPQKLINVYIKLARGKKIVYDAGGTNGANKLYLVFISDSAAVPNPQMQFVARLTYVDA